mmetsp:Transcript_17900/g.34929  ORF Transcript_17900/g.34929 Transcript_17900/m.34929 type:complete len:200 (+) Transcript_17900:547-1146(+)
MPSSGSNHHSHPAHMESTSPAPCTAVEQCAREARSGGSARHTAAATRHGIGNYHLLQRAAVLLGKDPAHAEALFVPLSLMPLWLQTAPLIHAWPFELLRSLGRRCCFCGHYLGQTNHGPISLLSRQSSLGRQLKRSESTVATHPAAFWQPLFDWHPAAASAAPAARLQRDARRQRSLPRLQHLKLARPQSYLQSEARNH